MNYLQNNFWTSTPPLFLTILKKTALLVWEGFHYLDDVRSGDWFLKKAITSDQQGEFTCSAWSPDHHFMQSQQGGKCENWQCWEYWRWFWRRNLGSVCFSHLIQVEPINSGNQAGSGKPNNTRWNWQGRETFFVGSIVFGSMSGTGCVDL